MWHSKLWLHSEAKTPRSIVNNTYSHQYSAKKIKSLMDKEQFECFESVVWKTEDLDHPMAELLR